MFEIERKGQAIEDLFDPADSELLLNAAYNDAILRLN
jgi:hypothetical protein